MSDTDAPDDAPAAGDALHLPPHRLKVVLLQPQIAPNTGNIARLCVATGAELHLVRPLGFVLSDRELKRSAMDYWDRLKLTVHDDTAAFFRSAPVTAGSSSPGLWFFSTKGSRSLWTADFLNGDYLVFGSETHGIGESILQEHGDRTVRIPQSPGERCLNLSTAAGVGLYEAIRSLCAGRERPENKNRPA